jgi:hypothetical protein
MWLTIAHGPAPVNSSWRSIELARESCGVRHRRVGNGRARQREEAGQDQAGVEEAERVESREADRHGVFLLGCRDCPNRPDRSLAQSLAAHQSPLPAMSPGGRCAQDRRSPPRFHAFLYTACRAHLELKPEHGPVDSIDRCHPASQRFAGEPVDAGAPDLGRGLSAQSRALRRGRCVRALSHLPRRPGRYGHGLAARPGDRHASSMAFGRLMAARRAPRRCSGDGRGGRPPRRRRDL